MRMVRLAGCGALTPSLGCSRLATAAADGTVVIPKKALRLAVSSIQVRSIMLCCRYGSLCDFALLGS